MLETARGAGLSRTTLTGAQAYRPAPQIRCRTSCAPAAAGCRLQSSQPASQITRDSGRRRMYVDEACGPPNQLRESSAKRVMVWRRRAGHAPAALMAAGGHKCERRARCARRARPAPPAACRAGGEGLQEEKTLFHRQQEPAECAAAATARAPAAANRSGAAARRRQPRALARGWRGARGPLIRAMRQHRRGRFRPSASNPPLLRSPANEDASRVQRCRSRHPRGASSYGRHLHGSRPLQLQLQHSRGARRRKTRPSSPGAAGAQTAARPAPPQAAGERAAGLQAAHAFLAAAARRRFCTS